MKHANSFEEYGRKKIMLDSELALTYMDMKDYCLATIFSTYDITELESQKFMEHIDNKLSDWIGTDYTAKQMRAGSAIVEDYTSSFKDNKRMQGGSISAESGSSELPMLSMINNQIIKNPAYAVSLSKVRKELEKETKAWNENERNRDISKNVLKDLTHTKEQF